jgi:3-phenylpropionate/cinnamic acid dioxygenase small subunit
MSDTSRVADELAIRNLIARLAHFADTASLEAYATLFTDDAVWRLPAANAVGLPANDRQGKAEIIAGAAERRAAKIQGPGTNTRHIVTTIAVEFGDDPDHARATAYWSYVVDSADTPCVVSVGQYDDEFRRTGTNWKLAVRQITVG